jgi:putative nucleotidyltransferase with HDIG domain
MPPSPTASAAHRSCRSSQSRPPAAQRPLVLTSKQRRLAQQRRPASLRLARTYPPFITASLAALAAHDRSTAAHSRAVAVYARDIAAALALPHREQELAHQCALVHDLGKLALPPHLLEKPAPLTPAERQQLERHPEIGAQILHAIAGDAEIATIVRHHHERIDGNGYPNRLHGDQIPLLSRIIAVADSYNAITSDRPYHAATPSPTARTRLAQAAGTQLDPEIVATFERLLTNADEHYRTATNGEFAPLQIAPPPLDHRSRSRTANSRVIITTHKLAVQTGTRRRSCASLR